MSKSPAFQFYPSDWLSDLDVKCMTMAQRGAYITLICYCWQEDGIPNDAKVLKKLLECPTWEKLWKGIKHKFNVKNGKLYNKRLLIEREKQSKYHDAKVKAGRMGAKSRWQKDSTAKNVLMAKHSSSSSSSTSTSEYKKTPTGLFKAYCIKCGNQLFLNMKPKPWSSSECCGTDISPIKGKEVK